MSAANLKSLAWVFVRNEADNTVEVSLAYSGGFAYRRRLNLQTGRATYARADRMQAPEAEWIAVDERSGAVLVGYMPHRHDVVRLDEPPAPTRLGELLDPADFEITLVTHGGTPSEPDDPCAVTVAGDL